MTINFTMPPEPADTLTHTFSFGAATYALRSTLLDGEPWFVATDVCRALGLDTSKGTNTHTRRVAKDERCVVRSEVFAPVSETGSKCRGGYRSGGQLGLVSESGLYKLIMRSDKETAAPFQDWVTREVLPSIRKTGRYDMGDHGRTEMPLPGEFKAAMREVLEAQAAQHARLMEAQLAQHERLMTATIEALQESFARANAASPKLDERMRTARQLIAMGVAPGFTSQDLGGLLSRYCGDEGILVGRAPGVPGYGRVNTYPVHAAIAFVASRRKPA